MGVVRVGGGGGGERSGHRVEKKLEAKWFLSAQSE